jgi:hypothetical protein
MELTKRQVECVKWTGCGLHEDGKSDSKVDSAVKC